MNEVPLSAPSPPASANREGARINAFSIDVEDWFHLLDLKSAPRIEEWTSLESRVERNVDRLLGVVEDAGARATCFLLGWVAEHHPEAVKRATSGGHEIATHGYGHDLLLDLEPREFCADLERAIDTIGAVAGVAPIGYRAPGFSITEKTAWALEILAQFGLAFDSSIFPARRAHGGYLGADPLPHRFDFPSGDSLMEFPLSVTTILGNPIAYCGGGYLRLFPYWFIRSKIAAANARGESVILYIHPRDIDPDQPRISMPPHRRFKSYLNLDTTYDKLRRLLSEFRFGTISEALSQSRLGDERGSTAG